MKVEDQLTSYQLVNGSGCVALNRSAVNEQIMHSN